MTTTNIRVLVVDDSAFARKVVREVLSRADGIEVVGIARDGLDAIEKTAELSPDVLTLDLVMPNLDGVGVLHALAERPSPPRVVVVSMADAESDLVLQALEAGAVDVVHKPTALATARLYELADELVAKVRIAAMARPRFDRTVTEAPARIAATAEPRIDGRIVVIGASTGGPQAFAHLLPKLPGDIAARIAMALHIPAGYTTALAARLDSHAAVHVVEAHDGLVLARGMAAIARGGMHLKLSRSASTDGACLTRLDLEPSDRTHRPSVDVLFRSAAEAFGSNVLGVVLTGMGDDGVEGARAIRAAGGRMITEAESSCVVYGMPRAVTEAGLSQGAFTLDEMAAAIVARV